MPQKRVRVFLHRLQNWLRGEGFSPEGFSPLSFSSEGFSPGSTKLVQVLNILSFLRTSLLVFLNVSNICRYHTFEFQKGVSFISVNRLLLKVIMFL